MTNSARDVSVIILTHNRPDRCLDSVWHNALAMQRTRGEILVINNGAEPVQIPRTIAGIPCRVLQMPTNLGAAARNVGIGESTGEFLLMLDDDAYLDPGLVETMIRGFRADPGVGVVAFHIQNGEQEEGCLLPTVFQGCACGFRRSALEEAGGYPDGYLYYGEEYDLAFRLYQAGYRMAWVPRRRKVRHVRDSGGRSHGRIVRLLVRNNVYLWVRFFPWRHIVPALRDTLQRYALVAAKEGVPGGFLLGLAQVPLAIARGLWNRRPMSIEVFENVSLVGKLERLSLRLSQCGVKKVIVCGVGKLPSLWLATMRRNGLKVVGFRDFNRCWQGRSVRGVPVTVVGDGPAPVAEDVCLIVGTVSEPENRRWAERLQADLGMRPIAHEGRGEIVALSGNIDPESPGEISAFMRPLQGFMRYGSNGMPTATLAIRRDSEL